MGFSPCSLISVYLLAVSTWRSQEPRGSGITPLKRSRASKINDGFKRHKGRHSDCPAGAQVCSFDVPMIAKCIDFFAF